MAMGIATLALSACKNDEVSPEPPARLAKPAVSASAASSAPVVPSARGATPGALAPPSTAGPTTDPDLKYRELLGRARKLQKSGDLTGAEQAFIAATGSGRDIYHRAIAELSFLELQHRTLSHAEIEEQFLVASTSPEPEVRGQVWFNLAALYHDTGRDEAERAALARSLVANPSAAAKAKLGQRSRCVAELGPPGPTLEPVIVPGWAGVCRQLGHCTDEPVSEDEARKLACLECSGSAAEPDTSHGCTGDPPWRSSFGYQHFRMMTAFIAPAGAGHFFVIRNHVGGWPAVCAPFYDYSAKLAGDTLHVEEQFTASQVARGRVTPQADPENGSCWEAPQMLTHTFYNPNSGRLLAAVRIVDGFPVEVTLDVAARRVQLAGGGCDGSVPLDGSNRWRSAGAR